MPKIKIEKDTLLMALEDNSGYITWFLDKETGELFFRSENFSDDEQDDKVAMIDENPDRFLYIDPIPYLWRVQNNGKLYPVALRFQSSIRSD